MTHRVYYLYDIARHGIRVPIDVDERGTINHLGCPDEREGAWKAGALFYVFNTLDDLYRISADILGVDEQILRDKVAAEVSA